MRHITLCLTLLVVTVLLAIAIEPALAANEIGKVVAVRGRVSIERNSRKLDAKVKSPIEMSDTITTTDASKIKILFTDDSVLTLAEKSRLSVKEYVHSKETRGKSVFNLLDGKMRAVVGKTKFEVQTPTAVAAARGTVIFFEVGSINGVPFTRIICLEGTVGVKNTAVVPPSGTPIPGAPAPVLPATIDLTPGTMVTVFAGQPLPPAIPAPPAILEKLKQETATKVSSSDPPPSTTGVYDITTPTTTTTSTSTTTSNDTTPKPEEKPPVIVIPEIPKTDPPITNQQPIQYKGVRINISIPTVISPVPTGSTGSGGTSGFSPP